MQLQHLYIRAAASKDGLEVARGALDLAHARKEHQSVPEMFGERLGGGLGDVAAVLVGDSAPVLPRHRRRCVHGAQLVRRGRRSEHLCGRAVAAEQRSETWRVNRRTHRDERELRPQLAEFGRHRQHEIGVQRAFVHLIAYDAGRPLQRRVRDQPAQ